MVESREAWKRGAGKAKRWREKGRALDVGGGFCILAWYCKKEMELHKRATDNGIYHSPFWSVPSKSDGTFKDFHAMLFVSWRLFYHCVKRRSRHVPSLLVCMALISKRIEDNSRNEIHGA